MSTESQERLPFIDQARISVRGGRGGNGCVSFRREKYVDRGGPDGGNGGRGGDLYLQADPHKRSLLDLTFKPHFSAEDGSAGQGANKSGASGRDLTVFVPLGTVVYRTDDTGRRRLLVDLKTPGQVYLAAKGGRGGRGNASFKTKMTTAPKLSEKGEPGEAQTLDLELKVLADVGLIGLPNAGKSTLLARLTHARPKIASYPFTTLNPNLGVADWHFTRLIFADIPGLIEGAHAGKGLGHGFLKHIERTRMLFHLVEVTGDGGRSAHERIKLINEELRLYSPKLIKKPMVIVATKMDLTGSEEALAALRKKWKKTKIFPISAVTGEGVDTLLAYAAQAISESPAEEEEPVETEPFQLIIESDFQVVCRDDVFVVEGAKVERLAAMTHFNQPEAVRRFQNVLKKMGVEKELARQGAAPGDAVKIGKAEFIFEP